MRLFLLPLLSLLAGCAGTVTLDITASEGLTVNSGTWFSLSTDDGTKHSLVASNQAGLCKAAQDFFPSATERINSWFSTGADCSEGKTLFEALGEESAGLYSEDAAWMRIVLSEGSTDRVAPADQSYQAAGDPAFTLNLAWYRENTFVDAANNVDDACILGTAGLVFVNGNPYRTELHEDVGGSLDLAVDGDNVAVQGSVNLLDRDGADAGSVDYEFSATRCDIDVSGHTIWFMP